MHPHPGFPVFARLDDACAPCFDPNPLPAPVQNKGKDRLRKAQLPYQRLVAVAAVALIAAAALRGWRR